MSEQRTILTQNEIVALNEVLQNLAANLKLHINNSLSTAHGINAQINDYFDGVGDKYGNAVLMFEFGTPPTVTRLFVPAQVTTLGPARTSNGLISTAITPSGTFTSPGIPLANKPLITDFTAEILTQADIYNEILLAHANTVQADTGASQAHGGTTFSIGDVADSLGHTVGNYSVSLGINGVVYRLPATLTADGIAQPPRNMIMAQSPTAHFTAPTSTKPYYYFHESQNEEGFRGDFGAGLSWIVSNAAGAAPITYTWAYYPTSYTGSQAANPPIPSLTDPAWVNFANSGHSFLTPQVEFNWNIPGGNGNTGSKTFNLLDEFTGATATTWLKCSLTNSGGTRALLLRFYVSKG